MARERKPTIKYRCVHCQQEKLGGDFNDAQSWLYSNGKLPVCKECLRNIFESVRFQMDDQRSAVQRVCMMFDIYWSEKIYKRVLETGTEDIMGKYAHICNLKQHRG